MLLSHVPVILRALRATHLPIDYMDLTTHPAVAGILDAERTLLTELKGLLAHMNTPTETITQLGELIEQLDALFLVVVVGEFNAGKSSVLNALFGEVIMEEGPIPTTAKINILSYGEEPLDRQRSEFIIERRRPHALLQHLNLVDTPGTNSIVKQHQTITEDFIPRADLILFITSYDRPLTDSERQFLEFIRSDWGKRLIFVLNKADLAQSPDQLRQVLAHIETGCQELMGFTPNIFPVSAAQAFKAKTTAAPEDRATLWASSTFEPLERFMTETLMGPQRLALKLSAPLGSARQLLSGVKDQIQLQQGVVNQDAENLAAFDAEVADEDGKLREGYQRYLVEVDNLILEMERRGVRFLEDHIRVGQLKLLRDKDRFKEEFARQVIRDHERQIEDRMNDGVDWLLKRMFALWNWTLNHVTEHARMIKPKAEAGGDFFYNRSEVLNGMMREARRKIQSYDMKEEARRILEHTNETASLFMGTQAVAAGIGTVATLLVMGTAADAVGGIGLVSAGLLAVVGLFMLPRQRRKAVNDFRERIDELRAEMKKALSAQFDREVDEAVDKIKSLAQPYRSFITQETHRLNEAETEHQRLRDQTDTILHTVNKELGPSQIEASIPS